MTTAGTRRAESVNTQLDDQGEDAEINALAFCARQTASLSGCSQPMLFFVGQSGARTCFVTDRGPPRVIGNQHTSLRFNNKIAVFSVTAV
jgi:hypothetical protein